jgi:putative membrane protein insertion efficiency factor
LADGAGRRRGRWWDNCDCSPGCDVGDLGGLGDASCVPDCDCALFLLPRLLLRVMALAAPTRPPRHRPSRPGRAGMAAIRGYRRWLSPHLPTRCRQLPTCSAYGLEAVRRYGLLVGSRLTAARISRCNPSTARGTHDPVP